MTIDAEEEIFELREPPGDALERAREKWLPRLEAGLPFAEIMEIGSTAVAGVIGQAGPGFFGAGPARGFFWRRADLEEVLERDPRKVATRRCKPIACPATMSTSCCVSRWSVAPTTFSTCSSNVAR